MGKQIESVNLQYNMLVHWADGTNDSSTKHLMFLVLFLGAPPSSARLTRKCRLLNRKTP